MQPKQQEPGEDIEICFWKKFYETYYPESKKVIIGTEKGFSHLERICQNCEGLNYNCEAYKSLKDGYK